MNRDSLVDLIRCYALFLVFNEHFFVMAGIKKDYISTSWILEVVSAGTFAVSLFFILSGYYLCRAFDVAKVSVVSVKRILRLIPKATIIGITSLGLAAWIGIDAIGFNETTLISAFLVAVSPVWFVSNPGHYWTMGAEIWLLIWLALHFTIKGRLSTGWSIGLLALPFSLWLLYSHIAVGIMLGAPIFGSLLYYVNKEWKVIDKVGESLNAGKIILAIGLGLYLLGCLDPNWTILNHELVKSNYIIKSHIHLIAAVLVVIAAIGLSKRYIINYRALSMLSMVSYEFYLIHFIFVAVALHYSEGFKVGLALLWALAMGLSIIFSITVNRLLRFADNSSGKLKTGDWVEGVMK